MILSCVTCLVLCVLKIMCVNNFNVTFVNVICSANNSFTPLYGHLTAKCKRQTVKCYAMHAACAILNLIPHHTTVSRIITYKLL